MILLDYYRRVPNKSSSYVFNQIVLVSGPFLARFDYTVNLGVQVANNHILTQDLY